MKIINLTPHPINLVSNDGRLIDTIEPSGNVARISVQHETVGELCNVPLVKSVYGEIEGLPEPIEGVWYIVSGMVKSALPERKDLVVPAQLVRDDSGNVVGCAAFSV